MCEFANKIPSEEHTDDDGDDGGFGTKDATCQEFMPFDMWCDNRHTKFISRDSKTEDVALCVIPCPMDTDGQPQRTTKLIGRTEQQSTLKCDGKSAPPCGTGIDNMNQPENRG